MSVKNDMEEDDIPSISHYYAVESSDVHSTPGMIKFATEPEARAHFEAEKKNQSVYSALLLAYPGGKVLDSFSRQRPSLCSLV